MVIEGKHDAKVSFVLDNVPRASSPLREVAAAEAVGRLLAPRHRLRPSPPRIEWCATESISLTAFGGPHSFLSAVHHSYTEHRPLSLSPDMIWLLICQGVGLHIRSFPEDLRYRLVPHPGRLTLDERADGWPGDDSDSMDPWEGVLEGFSVAAEAAGGSITSGFIPRFSTSGAVEQAAFRVLLLEVLRSYFHYRLTTEACGIPAVALEGTRSDWEAIATRVEAFVDLGLEWWVDGLRPILQEFIRTASGTIDRGFWRSIYRAHDPASPQCGFKFDGWLLRFFPSTASSLGDPFIRNPALEWGSGKADWSGPLCARGEDRGPARPLNDTPLAGRLPVGFSRAAVLRRERDSLGRIVRRRRMEFVGGFLGVVQDPVTLALRPEIGWAVVTV